VEKVKRILLLFITVCLLTSIGCTNKNREQVLEPTGNQPIELVKLKSDGVADQNASNQAKEIVSRYEEIAGVRAVNYDNQLIVAIDVDHLERFNLKKIEKELREKINESFSDMIVTLSTDRKILIELEKIEKEIQAKSISKEELKKQIEHLKKLSKEQT